MDGCWSGWVGGWVGEWVGEKVRGGAGGWNELLYAMGGWVVEEIRWVGGWVTLLADEGFFPSGEDREKGRTGFGIGDVEVESADLGEVGGWVGG